MKPVAEHMACYHVETEMGTELVPEDVCGVIDTDMANASEAEMVDASRVLSPYVEGGDIRAIERLVGWYARLSAPGYLDCTEWQGPFDTEGEALASVKETFDVDDNGDDPSDDDETGGAS